MAKRSTRRMRGGFLNGIVSLFTGQKKQEPVLPVTAPAGTGASTVIPVNPQPTPNAVSISVAPPMGGVGGARKVKRTMKRKTARKASRKASRKNRKCMYRKH